MKKILFLVLMIVLISSTIYARNYNITFGWEPNTEPDLAADNRSIDPLVARKFKTLLKKTVENGTVVIFATHILSLAQDVSQRIGVIIDGKIVTEGSLDELLKMSAGQNLDDFYFNTVMNYEKSI